MIRQNPAPNDNVTRIVRTLLAHRGQQQAELGAHLEMDSGTISRALNGKRRWSIDDLVAMAEFFEVSPALFFEDSRTLIRSVSSITPSDPDGGGVSRGITSRNTGENYLDDTLLKIAA